MTQCVVTSCHFNSCTPSHIFLSTTLRNPQFGHEKALLDLTEVFWCWYILSADLLSLLRHALELISVYVSMMALRVP